MTKFIVLDAGHGGKDSGAVGFGIKEKDLTLKIVKKIGKLLGDYEGVKVLYTRSDDRFLELSERAAIANKAEADFFLSVHINAGGGMGFETYVHTNASSKSVAYQNVIHPEIYKALGKVKDRGKKRANYAVLRQTEMPSILTENLFIDNATDKKLLKQDDYLDKVAHGHVEGFVKSFGLKKKATNKEVYHVIDKDDTFWGLEIELKLKHGTLQKLNPKVDPTKLNAGQKIRVK